MLRWLLRTEVRAALVAVLLARTAVNGGYRIVYPFLPEIARGLGTSLGVMGVLLAVRAAAGLAAPLIPRISERVGRRAVMLAGIAATALGSLALAGAPGIGMAALAFAVIGWSKPAFDVPMQGWFGQRVPYARRGRALGITELSWALSLTLAFPAGFLIAATSWRSPFLLVVGLALLGGVAVSRLMADDRPAEVVRQPLRLTRPLVAVLGVVLAFRMAAELLFVVYGSWLEDDFGMTVGAIGTFTLLVVAAELAGEGAVAAFSDRVGLKRSVLIGLLGSAAVYASLGAIGSSLPLAMVAVVGWFLLFEVSIVATIPLVTELGGAARDRLLSLMAAVAVGSGGLAALIAPWVYATGGIALSGLVAAGCVLAAAAVLALAVPPPVHPGPAR